MRRGKLSDSNRFTKTPTSRFYLSGYFSAIALVDSHDFSDRKRNSCLPDLESPLRRPPVVQALLGSLVAHSRRSFLRPVPPITLAFLRSALGRFLGRLYLTYTHSFPRAVDRARWVHISTVPQFQAHLPGFLRWSRGPRARAAGGSLHTDAILKTLSVGDVSDSLPIGGHVQP